MADMKTMGYSLTFMLIAISSVFTVAQFRMPGTNPGDLNGVTLIPQQKASIGIQVTDKNLRGFGNTISTAQSGFDVSTPTTSPAYFAMLGSSIGFVFKAVYSLAFSWIELLNLIGKSFGFPVISIMSFNVTLLAALVAPLLVSIEMFMFADLILQIIFGVGGRKA